ncbi:MAG: type VI secretion system baseplate subunit TssE [Rhodospirillales bacterium]|nr:type VI secretion system baseplate subunit TssE [Rhodospirillales bacterium]
MARPDLDQPLVLSLLDRLIDEHPEASRDPPKSRGQHLRELRDSVRRDLENLLNTRQRCRGWPEGCDELSLSTVNYGIPDLTGADLASAERREEFRATIEEVIRRFEPRFVRVHVSMLDNTEPTDRTLRFRIEALIYADPAPEPLVFDSYLDPASRGVAVLGDRNG